MGLFFGSLLIGISIAAPVGPIGVLCIRRTLVYGRWLGFLSGLGAATADAFYGFVAAFGFAALTDVLLDQVTVLQVVGGLFLLWLGWRTLRAQPPQPDAAAQVAADLTPLRAYGSILVLTLTNPMTILAFVGIFAGLDQGAASLQDKLIIVLGVFSGSLAWWLMLSMGVGLARRGISTRMMGWINRVSGMVIILFALRILLG